MVQTLPSPRSRVRRSRFRTWRLPQTNFPCLGRRSQLAGTPPTLPQAAVQGMVTLEPARLRRCCAQQNTSMLAENMCCFLKICWITAEHILFGCILLQAVPLQGLRYAGASAFFMHIEDTMRALRRGGWMIMATTNIHLQEAEASSPRYPPNLEPFSLRSEAPLDWF